MKLAREIARARKMVRANQRGLNMEEKVQELDDLASRTEFKRTHAIRDTVGTKPLVKRRRKR